MNTKYSYSIIALFLISAVHPAHAQLARRTPEQDSANYQGLIRKNLELRREMQALEKRYADLENERKVLILHVKDLQAARDSTNAVIQDLKAKIAALRIEMLKDPETLRSMEGLTQQLRQAQEEKGRLQESADLLSKEKERLLNEVKAFRERDDKREALAADEEKALEGKAEEAGRENVELREALEKARADFEGTRDSLDADLKRAEKEKANLVNENRQLADELKGARAALGSAEAALRQMRDEGERARDSNEAAKSARAESVRLKEENKKLENALAKAESSLQEARTALRTGTQEAEKARKEQEESDRDKLRRLENAHQQALKDIGSEKEELKARNRELTKELNQVKSFLDIANAAVERRAGQSQLQAVDGERERLKEEVKRIADERDELKRQNEELARALKNTTASLEEAKAGLEENIGKARVTEAKKAAEMLKIEGQKKDLEKEIEKIKTGFQAKEQAREQQIARAKEEAARLETARGDDTRRLREQLSEKNKEVVRLEVDLKRAKKESEAAGKRLPSLEEQVERIKAQNEQLAGRGKKLGSDLKEAQKDLKDQARKAAYDTEYFKQKAKDATADKMMVEEKARDLEQRLSRAQAELGALKKESETNTARTSLQESEIMVLREEKSKLEQKLIRYIEKIIEGDAQKGAKPEKGAPAAKSEPPKKKAESRKQMAQRKLDMHYNLAIAYDKRGMYREEEREYLKCLGINPKDANVHYNLAILYDDKLNRNKEAIAHYKRFIELRPIGEEVNQVRQWILHAEQEDRFGPGTK